MRYKLYILFLTLAIALTGCSNISTLKSNNLNVLSDNAFKYKGTWVVESYYRITDNSYNDTEDLIGKEVQIAKDAINIFNDIITDVRYKLKVVDKSYIISYENNITAEKFIGNKKNLDIISVIDNNMTLCELIILDDSNIVMIYKSELIHLNKFSNNINFNVNYGDVINNDSIDENSNNGDIGVMIGLRNPRRLKDDGTYTEEEYRTIWISYKNDDINSIYEKENIIFPRMNGIWTIKAKYKDSDNKHFDYFEVSKLEGKVVSGNEYAEYTENNYSVSSEPYISTYKSINFIGNDYIALQSYEGENFINEYPNYKIVPIDNINTNSGLRIEEIFNKDIKDLYDNDFKKAYENINDEEKNNYKNTVDYTNLTMARNDGKWILKGKIKSTDENKSGKDFKISTEPSKKIINFNSLLVPWKILKGEIPFLSDAYTSPNGEMAIIRYKKYLSVYRVENGHLQGSPLINIPLQKNEEIIMAEWCTSGYVDEWQKAFNDGISIYIEEE